MPFIFFFMKSYQLHTVVAGFLRGSFPCKESSVLDFCVEASPNNRDATARGVLQCCKYMNLSLEPLAHIKRQFAK